MRAEEYLHRAHLSCTALSLSVRAPSLPVCTCVLQQPGVLSAEAAPAEHGLTFQALGVLMLLCRSEAPLPLGANHRFIVSAFVCDCPYVQKARYCMAGLFPS
eukprot:COSAG05_NODE_18769_length_303_cov_0.764706_1_plen_101_part_11